MPQPPFTSVIGSPFIELQSVDSTNNYARQQIATTDLPYMQEPITHGTAFFAHEQVAGKGQRGKIWVSEKGANIALSIVLKPQSLRLAEQFQLSACVALAVLRVMMKYTGDNTKIKWPNDLYWQDRKAGGILIESIVNSRETAGQAVWEWAIAGIGINVNQVSFPEHLPNPVSVKQITGKSFEPLQLAREICTSLDQHYQQLLREGFDPIFAAYNSLLYKRNEAVRLKKESRVFEVIIKGVSETGQLITEHGIEERFDFGEVEWMI